MKRSGRKSSMKGEIEYDASESITIGGPPSLSEKQRRCQGSLPCKWIMSSTSNEIAGERGEGEERTLSREKE